VLRTQLPIDPNIPPERMRLLLAGAMAASQSLNPQEIAGISLQMVSVAIGSDAGLVAIFQRDQRIVLASRGFSADWLTLFRSSALDLRGTLLQQTLKTESPTILPNLQEVFASNEVKLFRQANLKALACFPVDVPGNAPGILVVGCNNVHQFSLGDEAFLLAVAAQINAGLRNAWLYAQSQRQLKEVKAVAEAARTVVSSLDLSQILTRIMEEVTTRLNTQAAALLLLDSLRQELEFAAVAGPASEGLTGIRLPMGQGIVGWVAQHNEPLLVPDVTKDERFYKGLDKQTETVSQAILCVPLRARDQLIGVVEVINKKSGKFTSADQRLLESLATFAAVAIENARLFEEANRQIKQATLYARDLSTSFKQERQQRTALDRLRYSFLNVVSHELKTPLTVILQGIETLKNPRRGPLNKEQTGIIDMLQRQSNQLERLIDGLVAFATFSARQGTMQFKAIPFETVLDDVLALSKFKGANKQIILEDHRQSQLPTLMVDKDRIAEAIMYLVDNAVKFSSPGSRVKLQSFIEGDDMVIQVVDHGQGIPADQIDRIWDSFTQMNTTMERGLEGLGLGLAIARYIVEAHNGHISVASEMGKGSIFTVRLPINHHAAKYIRNNS